MELNLNRSKYPEIYEIIDNFFIQELALSEIQIKEGKSFLYIKNQKNKKGNIEGDGYISNEQLENFILDIFQFKTDEFEEDEYENEISSSEKIAFELRGIKKFLLKGKSIKRNSFNDFIDEIETKGYKLLSFEYKGYSFKCNITMGEGGGSYLIVLRKIYSVIPTPFELGLPSQVIDSVETYNNGGLIVFAGPPGNGKSTSLASLVQHLLNKECVVVDVLEEAKEYKYKESLGFVNQREEKIDFDNYSSAIESIIKGRKVDVVVLQEVNNLDKNLIESLIKLLQKGRLVITTIHSITVEDIFSDMLSGFSGTESDSVLESLSKYMKIFVGQRLVPSLDNNNIIPVFEFIKNSDRLSSFLEKGNVKAIETLFGIEDGNQKSFPEDIKEKISKGLISRYEGEKICPEPRKYLFDEL